MKTKARASKNTVLIFSDTHLTHKFDKPKFDYLKQLISKADLVVINGDFWDYYLTTWEDFITSEWQALFPLLKQKKAIYVYGNHDQKAHSDERVNLFSVAQTYEFVVNSGNKMLHIQHGHLITPTLDVRSSTIRHKAIMRIAEKMEEFNVLFLSKLIVHFFARRQNKHMKQYLEAKIPDGEYLICGHTHIAEFKDGSRFINTGWIRYRTAQALQVQNGVFTFLNSKY